MTPQVRSNATAAAGRFSLGGGEARRVVVEQPWRVKDIVVPAPGARAAPSTPAKPVFGSPVVRGVGRGAGRDTISEEERKVCDTTSHSLTFVNKFGTLGYSGTQAECYQDPERLFCGWCTRHVAYEDETRTPELS